MCLYFWSCSPPLIFKRMFPYFTNEVMLCFVCWVATFSWSFISLWCPHELLPDRIVFSPIFYEVFISLWPIPGTRLQTEIKVFAQCCKGAQSVTFNELVLKRFELTNRQSICFGCFLFFFLHCSKFSFNYSTCPSFQLKSERNDCIKYDTMRKLKVYNFNI